jgi:hypothetical protein
MNVTMEPTAMRAMIVEISNIRSAEDSALNAGFARVREAFFPAPF